MADRNQIIKSRRGFRGVATRHIYNLKQILEDEETSFQIFSTITDDEALEEIENAEQNNNTTREARDELKFQITQLEKRQI